MSFGLACILRMHPLVPLLVGNTVHIGTTWLIEVVGRFGVYVVAEIHVLLRNRTISPLPMLLVHPVLVNLRQTVVIERLGQ